MDKLTEEIKATKQRLVGLEQETRQARFAMEANVPSGTKTRKRTEGAAAADQAMNGYDYSAKTVHAGPTSSTSFGMKVESPALPLAGMTSWSIKPLRRQSHVSHPWRCAR